jgi:hypothetical protein
LHGGVRKINGTQIGTITVDMLDSNGNPLGSSTNYDLDYQNNNYNEYPSKNANIIIGNILEQALVAGTSQVKVTLTNVKVDSINVDTDQDYIIPDNNTWWTMRDGSFTGTVSVQKRHGVILMLEKP